METESRRLRWFRAAAQAVAGNPYKAAIALAALSFTIQAAYDFRGAVPLSILYSGGVVRFSAAMLASLLQSAAVFFLIVSLPRLVRVVLAPLLLVVVIVQFTYWEALKTYMLSTDWFLALTVGADHFGGAIVSFLAPLAFVKAIPFALLIAGIAYLPSMRLTRREALVAVLSVVFLLSSNYLFYLRVDEKNFIADPITHIVRTICGYQFRKAFEYNGPRDPVPAVTPVPRPKSSVLYVIDESVRGSNLGINGYSRDTTPFLRSLVAGGRLDNFGICAAVSVYSHVSIAYLISGATAMPDREFRTAKNPTLFDFAKAMGYKTVFIDVDHTWLSVRADEEGTTKIQSVDQWLRDASLKAAGYDLPKRKDLAVADAIAHFLNQDEGVFILVAKKGLHFPYRIRVPEDPAFWIWQPMMGPNDAIDPSPEGREKLVNTFDNGLRYEVDEFFRELQTRTSNRNYVVLYTSDHGQTLSESGQRYTHAKPDKVIVDVPCFLIRGDAYHDDGLIEKAVPGIRVSHLNLFASVLDLLGVPESIRVRSYPKSIFELTDADNKVRPYLTGSLNGDSRGFGAQYSIGKILDPPDPGWGLSQPPSPVKAP